MKKKSPTSPPDDSSPVSTMNKYEPESFSDKPNTLDTNIASNVQEDTGVLHRSEQKYKNLFQNSLVGIFRTSLVDGLILEANSTLQKITFTEQLQSILVESLLVI